MKNNNQKIGDLGQHWTPPEIVDKMISLIRNNGSILEPSAGIGKFVEKLPKCTALEIDEELIPSNNSSYININFFDFSISEKFDTIIGNPPYVAGRLLEEEWFSSWKGKIPKTANSYLHFIEKSLYHLNNNGELIFIVPSTLFSATSRGKKLRKRMMQEGSFTHVFYHFDLKWDNAAIETLIFRWQKDLFKKNVVVDGVTKNIVENDGFIWLLDYEPVGKIGDFFDVKVGSAPLNSEIDKENCKKYDYYFKEGKLLKICEDQRDKWPRVRDTEKNEKIFFNGGPIRRWPVFYTGNYSKHLDHVLIPKNDMDTHKVSKVFNAWFQKNGENLTLIKGGRWAVGIKQFESFPINKFLLNILSNG